jgi:hypothetical protein
VLFQQRGNTIGRLCAQANPVVHALDVNPQIFLVVTTNRVKKANTFDIPAVPFAPARESRILTITFPY